MSDEDAMRNAVRNAERQVIGLVSDTHGMVRPALFEALAGVDRILHAGDVGGAQVLAELGAIAPVLAVYGNTDPVGGGALAGAIDETIGGVRVHVSHGHELGSPTPAKLLAAYDADVIVYGHTHRQLVHRAPDGRLVINPGAAGARRFDLVPCVARLTIDRGRAEAELLPL